MKKQFFFSMLAGAAMLASCSSENVVNENNNSFFENGEGYLSLAINLPTVPSITRANDVFDDGLASEYRVNDATLILFAGSDEASATFSQAYTLKSAAWNNVDDDPNQITVQRQVTQKIKSASGNLYAFVVLNKNGVFEVTTGDNLNVGGSTFTGTISDLQDEISTADFTNDGILMMNAPQSKLAGTSTTANPGAEGYEITTLAPVNAANIKPTAAEAEAAPAANIYVERAVAKTTVNVSGSITTSFAGSDGVAINYTVNGWKLDNTKKNSYIAHKCDATATSLSLKSPKTGSLYRMAGNAIIETGAGYRYYWAIDPDYSDDIAAANVNRLYGTTPSFNALSATVPEYCKENTFDVAHQTYKNTTSVLVKATLNGGTTFYTVNDENKVYTEANAKDAFVAVYLSRAEVATWLAANLEDGHSHTLTASDFDFTYSVDADSKLMTVTGVAVSSTFASSGDLKAGYAAAPTATEILNVLNETKVLQYAGGVSYYEVRVKHFGDDLTPWNTWEAGQSVVAPSPATAYPGSDAADINNRYLGRYGMVRNNWYDITIDKILKIGSPIIPNISADNTTDDNLESYISVKINVLSWAKRTQSVTL